MLGSQQQPDSILIFSAACVVIPVTIAISLVTRLPPTGIDAVLIGAPLKSTRTSVVPAPKSIRIEPNSISSWWQTEWVCARVFSMTPFKK